MFPGRLTEDKLSEDLERLALTYAPYCGGPIMHEGEIIAVNIMMKKNPQLTSLQEFFNGVVGEGHQWRELKHNNSPLIPVEAFKSGHFYPLRQDDGEELYTIKAIQAGEFKEYLAIFVLKSHEKAVPHHVTGAHVQVIAGVNRLTGLKDILSQLDIFYQ